MTDIAAELEALLHATQDRRTADTLVGAILELRELREALGPRRLLVLRTAREVEALHRRGLSIRQIGVRVHLSRSRVQQLLAGNAL